MPGVIGSNIGQDWTIYLKLYRNVKLKEFEGVSYFKEEHLSELINVLVAINVVVNQSLWMKKFF